MVSSSVHEHILKNAETEAGVGRSPESHLLNTAVEIIGWDYRDRLYIESGKFSDKVAWDVFG